MKIKHGPIILITLILAALAGALIGSQSPIAAQGVTPVPGRHSEVRTPFYFVVKDTPQQLGWRAAEFKDEYGTSYYKADVAPGCGAWQVAPGTEPGLVLTPGGKNCLGFTIQFGVLYWFDAPLIVVTPPPFPSPSQTATVTPPPSDGATAIPPLPTPSPQVTPAPFPTLTPAQLNSFTVYCASNGMMYVTIWGGRDIVVSVDREWCVPFYVALLELLRRVSETAPTKVIVRD